MGQYIDFKMGRSFSCHHYDWAAVLAYTAAKMIVDEKWFAGFFESNPFVKWAFIIIIIIGVVFFGKAKQKQQLVLSHNDGIFTNKRRYPYE